MTYGMLRVKNEGRWIGRVINALKPVCCQILVIDDDSTDDTREVAAAHGATVLPTPFSSRGFIHEGQDKDWLLQQVWAAGAQIGDHVVCLDGDEELDARDLPALQQAIADGIVCGSMHILYLWDKEDQIRVDRCYKEFKRPSIFQLTARNLTFLRTSSGGNFHCSSAPAQLLDQIKPLPVRLLHYGYLYKEDRVRKYHWYNKIDPNNPLEDGYRHMVVGDIFPADSSFRHAGPLEVQPL